MGKQHTMQLKKDKLQKYYGKVYEQVLQPNGKGKGVPRYKNKTKCLQLIYEEKYKNEIKR